MSDFAICPVCFRHCKIKNGAFGACLARYNRDGKIIPYNYGKITSLALDPIEKKPLYHFYPGSLILSLGSYGCNLFCPFCQNYEISRAYEKDGKLVFENASGKSFRISQRELLPEEARDLALSLKERGNIGIAFTYNEPLVGYEYVRDTAKLIKETDMKTVLVSNGEVSLDVLNQILPYIDAMNIDLKAFNEENYRDILGGDLPMVKAFLEKAAPHCHLEITSLIVPGLNDSPEEMEEAAKFIQSLNGGKGREIPYHLSRFFPRYKSKNTSPTDPKLLYQLQEIAEKYLDHVYLGNI